MPGQGNGHQTERKESGERVPGWEGVCSPAFSLLPKGQVARRNNAGARNVAQWAENLLSRHGQEDQKFKANLGY